MHGGVGGSKGPRAWCSILEITFCSRCFNHFAESENQTRENKRLMKPDCAAGAFLRFFGSWSGKMEFRDPQKERLRRVRLTNCRPSVRLVSKRTASSVRVRPLFLDNQGSPPCRYRGLECLSPSQSADTLDLNLLWKSPVLSYFRG